MAKLRLDLLLVQKGLCESRQKAQALVMAGEVLVNDQPIDKPGQAVSEEAQIRFRSTPRQFVSRGGEKLQGALDHFFPEVKDRVCLDLGSSTGGFTDCLLKNGARLVYAVDVGSAQLHESLRQDSRVRSYEKTHIARLSELDFVRNKDGRERPSLVVMDLSFISLSKTLPYIVQAELSPIEVIALIKPQFELDREDVSRGGVVRDAKLHEKALDRVKMSAERLGMKIIGTAPSIITGAKKGNQEFFIYCSFESG